MNNVLTLFRRLALCTGVALGLSLAQDTPPPNEPFQAVHLYRIDGKNANAEKMLLEYASVMSEAIAKAGCRECSYHIYKASATQGANVNYIRISNWPGRAVYEKVHNNQAFLDAYKKRQDLQSIVLGEEYNRFVELKPAK